MKPTVNHANDAKENFPVRILRILRIFRGLIPDHTDTQPLPAAGQSALWKYKAIYRQGDDRVGQWSGVVNIPVAGQTISPQYSGGYKKTKK
jgi:hypothetical protein